MRRSPPHEHVGSSKLASSRCDNRANELQVLEQYVAVVASRRLQRLASHAKRSRPITARDAVDERPRGIKTGMPGKRIEVVLRSDDVRVLERSLHLLQSALVVSHIVVGDDEPTG